MNTAFINGKIYCSFKPLKVVEAMLIENGRIKFLGRREEILKLCKDSTEIVDLDGKVVIPGFVDTHVHLDELGIFLNSLNLRDAESIDDLKRRLKEFAKRCKTYWIIGYGWDQELLGRYPTKNDLDEVVKDRPVLLSRFCLHAGVVNSKAIEICEMHKFNKPFIDLERGIVKEFAYSLVRRKVRESFSRNELKYILKSAMDHVLSFGVTSVGFMGCRKEIFEILKEMNLNLRVFVYTRDFYEKFSNCFLNVKGVKVFLDGSLGVKTALLSEPYEDDDTCGCQLMDEYELEKIVRDAERKGYQVALHAIGDRAIDLALNVLEKVKGRNRIEHASVLRDDQVERLSKIDVVISVQPHFIEGDWWIAKRLGKRTRWVYRIRSLLERGIKVGFGTDAPVEPVNPWETVYYAVTRGKYEGLEIYDFTRDEVISVQDALNCYTINSAYVLMEEGNIGSLEVGKFADFIILDKDPLEIDEKDLKKIKVLKTFVNGKLVNECY